MFMPVTFKTIKKISPLRHHPHWVAWTGMITALILGFGATTQFLLSTAPTSTISVVPAAACPDLKAGARFKVAGFNAVYLLNENRERIYFPSSDVYHTWFENFTGIIEIAPLCIDDIPLPSRPPYGVNYRPGSRLVKLRVSPHVYVIEPGNRLAKLDSEAVAEQLYGQDWRRLVRDLSDEFWPNFVAEDPTISEPKPHEGMIVAGPNDATAYYVQNGQLRPLQGNLLDLTGIRVHTLPATVFAALEKSSSTLAAREIPGNPTQATIFVERINALSPPNIPSAATSTATTTVITTPIVTTTLPVKPPITPTTTTTAPPVLVTTPPAATPANPIAPPAATITTPTTPAPANTTPPVISNIQVNDITQISATISWNTNESASTSLYYSLQSQSAGPWRSANQGGGTAHTTTIVTLTPATTYYFYIVASDSIGNTATSTEQSFPTKSPPPSDAGTTKWQFQASKPIAGHTAIATDDTVYVSVWDCKLYALDKNGNQKWIFAAPTQNSCVNRFTSPSVGLDGTVYAGLAHSVSEPAVGLYAINPDGTQKWLFSVSSSIFSPIIIGSDTVYAIDNTAKKLYAISFAGTQKWVYQSSTAYLYQPVLGPNGTIYVRLTSGIMALNPDGTQKWIFEPGIYFGDMAVDANGVIYAGGGAKLYAINHDGTEKWSVPLVGSLKGRPAIGQDGTLYITAQAYSSEVNYYALTVHAFRADGSLQWQFSIGAGEYSDGLAIGSDGVIYVPAELYFRGGTPVNEGRIFALNPNGTQKWLFNTGQTTNPTGIALSTGVPAIGSDGTLYAGINLSVYAIKSDSAGLANSPWPRIYQNNQNTGR